MSAAGLLPQPIFSKTQKIIDNIDPPYWWAGMEDPSLQLLIHGSNIADSDIRLHSYHGVEIDSIVSPGSPNYVLLYLNIGKETTPGKLDFELSPQNGKPIRFTYELKKRNTTQNGRSGFDASDVLYLIMPDRFADGDKDNNDSKSLLSNPAPHDRTNPNARHGGDIQGIIDHLDYIDTLGVTAVWVCPVLENDMPGGSYHGYATTNYYKIDPRLGTNEKWNELVDSAHSRGIKVVMDMIFNHSGSSHPWMSDMPSETWYNHPDGNRMTNFRLSTLHDPYASDYDIESSTDGWFVPSMPDLNQRNPHVAKYLTQNSIWWIESSAIDGIRMDTYPYADAKAMAQWIVDVRRQYPDFDIVGECWYTNTGAEAFWQKASKVNHVDPELETVMDFGPTTQLRSAFTEKTDPWNGLNKVYDHLSLDFLYPNPQRVLTFLDNHDTDRWLTEMPDSLDQWKQAVTWLLTTRGIPQIYYGTEILMHGTKEKSDGLIRLDMPGGFPGDTTTVFDHSGRSDMQNEAYSFIRSLLKWRKGSANPIIATGRLKHFMPQNGLYVYSRKLDDKEIVVIMNGTDEHLSATMERTTECLPYGSDWTDITTNSTIRINPEMSFAPRQILILQNF
ncbi:MAG: glycoside hydrolase family 13 protein [Muribaculum sp.]|nr:glycoside hydrolase family 13 protein [Muribaculum sp.]